MSNDKIGKHAKPRQREIWLNNMSDTENKETIAVCKDCGHTWKPRNTATNATRRKCSKCQSERIELKTEEYLTVKTDIPPTPENIAKLINTPPAENPPEAKISCHTPGTTSEDNINKIYPIPNIHPAAWFVLVIGAIGIGATVYFRRMRQRQRKDALTKTQKSTTQKNEQKQPVTPRIIGL